VRQAAEHIAFDCRVTFRGKGLAVAGKQRNDLHRMTLLEQDFGVEQTKTSNSQLGAFEEPPPGEFFAGLFGARLRHIRGCHAGNHRRCSETEPRVPRLPIRGTPTKLTVNSIPASKTKGSTSCRRGRLHRQQKTLTFPFTGHPSSARIAPVAPNRRRPAAPEKDPAEAGNLHDVAIVAVDAIHQGTQQLAAARRQRRIGSHPSVSLLCPLAVGILPTSLENCDQVPWPVTVRPSGHLGHMRGDPPGGINFAFKVG